MFTECLLSVLIFSLSVSAEEDLTYTHQDVQQDSGSTDELIPCEKGWYVFGDKCYKLGGKKKNGRLNREKASERCKSEGGTLATISSKELEDFLITFLLLDVKNNAWIGIHDQTNESNYVWEDNSTTSYTNWEPGEPSGTALEHEDCVEMVFMSGKNGGKTGQWNDIGCDAQYAYMCQAEKSFKKSPDPRFCPGTGGDGWSRGESCYYVHSEKKSWVDAEKYCQDKYDGHLLMIPDFTANMYLDYILSSFNRDIWIGIKIQEKPEQKWTSGWFVAYNDWSEEQHFVNGTCALRSKQWTTNLCSKKLSFLCEKSSSVSPPVLKPAEVGAHCPQKPEGWLDLDGEYCYFIDTKNYYNWYRASFECKRRGGNLVKIQYEEESDILQPFIIYKQRQVFIGLHRLLGFEDVFVWTDGSNLNWTNWESGEPNKEDEKCGELWTRTMKWNDVNCDEAKGYICSVRKVLSQNVTGKFFEDDACICDSTLSKTVIAICVLLVIILLCVLIYFLRPCGLNHQKPHATLVQFQPPVLSTRRPAIETEQPVMKEDCLYEDML